MLEWGYLITIQKNCAGPLITWRNIMPASSVMPLYRAGKLHSGSGGIVKKPAQATAILLSYLRKEGHDIPEKKATGFHSKKAR
jgi:hypothetical protein